MRNIRKIIARILIVVMLVTGIGIHWTFKYEANEVYAYSGGDYTSNSELSTRLNNVFNGNVALFSNSSARYAVGDTINKSTSFTVAGKITGKQCYIYANAVYYYLFGDIPFHGSGYSGYWNNSKVVLSNQASASYNLFKNAGVTCGSYLRTTSNSDGSYNGNSGHSLIILSYNSSGLTYLEGNGDGNGKTLITTKTWSDFNAKLLTNKGRRIAHVISSNKYSAAVVPTPGPTKDDVKLSNFNASEITSDSCKLSCTVTDKGYTRYSCKFVVGNHEYTPTRNGNTLYCYVKRSELGGGYGPHSWHASISFYELGVDIYGSRSFSFIAQPWVETSFREITRADSNALCEMTFTVHDPSHLCTRCEIGGVYMIDEDVIEAFKNLGYEIDPYSYIGDIFDSGTLSNGADGINGKIEFPIGGGSNPVSINLYTNDNFINLMDYYNVSDTEGPEIYDFKVSNVDSTGYDVYAKVRDVSGLGDRSLGFREGILRVYCYSKNPNNQSTNYRSYIQGDTISYHVSADLPGTYHNYFGAYDIYGNWNGMSFDVEVPAKPSATSTPTLKPTAAPTNKPTTTPRPTATPAPVQPGNSSTSSTNSSNSVGLGDFIERLYNVALGRPSEAYGKNYWINKVKFEGFTGADVARGFLFSEEFLGKNMSNSDFLDTLYLTFFNRPADEHKADWMTLMDQGWTKMQVIDGFINSTEWANLCLSYSIASGSNCSPNINIQPSAEVESFARRLYTTCLGRDADIGGLNNWAAQLANMQISGSQAAHGFFFSEEFIAHGFNNEEYVNRLYRTFMGREADPAGFADWVGQLNNGVSRESVFQGFAGSQEWAGICAEYGILK